MRFLDKLTLQAQSLESLRCFPLWSKKSPRVLYLGVQIRAIVTGCKRAICVPAVAEGNEGEGSTGGTC